MNENRVSKNRHVIDQTERVIRLIYPALIGEIVSDDWMKLASGALTFSVDLSRCLDFDCRIRVA